MLPSNIVYLIFENPLQLFEGTDSPKEISKQVLPVPVKAHYVRIYPLSYESWPCLRVELYGKGTHFLLAFRNCFSLRATDQKKIKHVILLSIPQDRGKVMEKAVSICRRKFHYV